MGSRSLLSSSVSSVFHPLIVVVAAISFVNIHAFLFSPVAVVPGFATAAGRGVRAGGRMRMMSSHPRRTDQGLPESRLQFLSGLAGGVAAVALPLAALADPPLELFKAGEVCIERNLNGSCKKFGISEASAEEKATVAKNAAIPEEPESELMTTLKRRTAENKAKNDEEVATKTFANGQAGEFGIFSRYIPVKHMDTGRFELVLISELDEMKNAGLVVNRGGTEYFTDAN